MAFVIDAYARRIASWRVRRTAHASFVLDALEQALHDRQPMRKGGVIHHSDRGVQYVSIRYTQRLPRPAEADRARAILLTLAGWTSAGICKAFGVCEDTVRLWRSDFLSGGVKAMKKRNAPGPKPVKAEAALRVAGPRLSAPVAERPNWALARLPGEIAR